MYIKIGPPVSQCDRVYTNSNPNNTKHKINHIESTEQ